MTLKINGQIVPAKFENGLRVTHEFPEANDKMEFVLCDDQDRPSIIRYVYEPIGAGDVVDLSWEYSQTIEITEEDIYQKRLEYEPLIIRVGKRRWVKIGFYKVLE